MTRYAGRTIVIALLAGLTLLAGLVVGSPSQATARPGHSALDPAVFANPGVDSRPTMLWFWNGTITTDLIDRQLKELRDRGIDQAVIFPFNTANLQPAFFTDGWFDRVGHALREAQAHGMKLWLFNDDYFSSGRGAGLVVNGGQVGGTTLPAHPELREQSLSRTRTTVTGPTTISLTPSRTGLSVQDGKLVVDAANLNGVATLKTGTTWTDYTLASTFTLGSGNAGFVVRAQDPRNGYLVDVRPDGHLEIYRQVDGAFTLLTTTPAVTGFDPAGSHTIRITVAGDAITPEIDGQQLPGATDATFAAGTIGVRAVATQKSTRDDLAVTAADGSALYQQSFDSPSALDDFLELANPPANNVVSASARPVGTTEATGVTGVTDLTAQATGDGNWTVPAGTWTVDTYHRNYLDTDGSYLDLMNPVATKAMLDDVPGEYYRRFAWAFGTVLQGFWDDEPYLASASAHSAGLDWSATLPAQLARTGAELGPALAASYDDLGRTGRVLRGDYWQTVSDLFADNYYKVQGDWMAAHHVAYISNPLWDEYGPAAQVQSTGDMSKDHQWAQVPGTDVIFDQYQPGGRTMLPRWGASSAHQNGSERVLLESFGGHGWDTDPQYMQATLGAFAVRGINLNVLHALWTDADNVVYPTQFEGINPWWNQSNPLNDWMGRIDYVASSKAAAPTALIVPEQASQAWQDSPTAAAIDSQFTAANDALEDVQSDFDLLPDTALSGDRAVRTPATVQHGTLAVGGQNYRLAVLPQTPTISLATVATLTAFVRSGGTLTAIGSLPTEETSGHDSALARALAALFPAGPDARRRLGSGMAVRVADPTGLAGVVQHTGVAAASLAPASPSVRVLRLEAGKQTAFLINNESGNTVSTTSTFPAVGRPQVWDPRTGSVSTAPAYEVSGNSTSMPLTLQPYQTTIVVIDSGARVDTTHLITGGDPVRAVGIHHATLTGQALVPAGAPAQRVVGQSGSVYFSGTIAAGTGLSPVPLDGPWTVTLEQPGAVPTSRQLGSWTTTDPSFTGAADYTRSFDLPAGAPTDRRWTLDLGDVGSAAEVTVNGHNFTPVLWQPYQLDVSSALVAGHNTISVRVTNTLANTKGIPKASGLLGPVTLTPARWTSFALAAAPRAGVVALTPPVSAAVAPGQTVTIPITVRRYGGSAGVVTVGATGSAGLTASVSTRSVPVGRNGTGVATLSLTAAATATSGSITLSAGGVDYLIPVTVDLASRLGVASASSSFGGHPVSSVNDGITSSDGWDQGQGWNDGTIDAFPDTATISFAAPAPIGRVSLFTLDSTAYPATEEGVVDVDLQLLVNGSWQTVDAIRANKAGTMTATFPVVTATEVRAVVLSSRDHYSRVIELQAAVS